MKMDHSLSESVFELASIVLCAAWFVPVHAILTRVCSPARLLVFSVMAFLVSTAAFLAISYSVVGHRFVDTASFVNYGTIVLAGSGGLCGLYTFLGPATADRSATAHMLTCLAEHGGRLPTDAITSGFDGEAFVRKRFAECMQAGIIEIRDESVHLTAKGRRLAAIYKWMCAVMKLESLPGYSFSFRRR
jgi:hypothetical protein